MDIDKIDQTIINQYPIPLALKYQRVIMEEDSFAKTKALTGALEALLKYCVLIAIQDSYRTKLNSTRQSPTIAEQLLNPTASTLTNLLTETLFLFRRNQEIIFEPELYLLIYNKFSETPQLRQEVSGLIQALLGFAQLYPYRGEIDSNELECETDFQAYFPLLKALYIHAGFLSALPLVYFHDPMDELEAMEQPSPNSFSLAEVLMGAQAISQIINARRLPGAPFGRVSVKSQNTNTLLSLHPLLMLVETIELLSAKADETLPIGHHLVIFYDEIQGADQEKLLRYWQAELPKTFQNLEGPKLTLTQGGLFNRFTEWIKTGRAKSRIQLAQQVGKYIEQRNLAAAILEFKKVYELEPDNLAIATRLGELYIPANQRQEAIDSFRKIAEKCMASGLVPQAMLMYQRVNKLNPKDIISSLKLANICAEQGCQEIALQQCERIVEYSSQTNDREGVFKALELAVSLEPKNPINQRRLAEIYLAKKQKPQALKGLLTAGEILFLEKQYPLAAEVYEEVLKIKPLHQLAFERLGYIYLSLEDYHKAIDMLVPCCQSEPNNLDFLRALGKAYLNNNELDQAYKTYLNLFQLDSNATDELLELGRRFLFVGQLDMVGVVLDSCIDALISQRKERQTINLLESSLANNPQHLASLKMLVKLYILMKDEANLKRTLQRLVIEARSQGNWEEAKAALNQLLNLEPRNSSYLVQLRDLENLR
ncbi:MAG: tetratricopeptide repeat protein [Acidobacteria bacterium]|nr:tetratricopeptide repeat protein [Acidobacteriota bacterium]